MKKALVVDNNEFYRKVLRDLLEEEAYEVSDAGDGISALRCIAAQRPDLILLDLVMPKMDGTKVCRHVKSDPRLRDIPVVVLSGILIEDMGNLRQIGADAYVAKMPLDRLLPTLRTVIRRLEEGTDDILSEGFEGMFRREIVVELLEEKRFRDLVFSSLAEGAAELDADLRIVSVNPAFAAILGRQEVEVIDQPVVDVLGLEPAVATDLFRRAGASIDGRRQPRRVELEGKVLKLHVSPVARDEEALGFMVLVEDITDFCRAEEEREQLRTQLAQTEKLSSLGRMVAGIAHELNNPLTGVLGYTQLLLERGAEGAQKRDLEKIFRESKRCQAIVENLLAFSRRAVPLRRPEDLNELTREALSRFAADFSDARVALEVDLEQGLPPVELDRAQWVQVITQIARNAQQAMKAAGGEGHLRVVSRRAGDRVLVEIEDTGIGIAEANLPRIFDPFFTTAGVGEGSGLGLSVVYGIVREHGGRIRATSREGEGTRFSVELPIAMAPKWEGDAELRGSPAPAGGSHQILVVDDEPVILDLLVDLLEGQGARVETASNGVEALRKLKASRYDAVVLDLKMPEMGGREVYERLAEVAPQMRSRVLFSTGDMVSAEAREFFRETDVPVIQKPFQIEQITRVLARFLTPAQSRQ